jgi:hypothetical protein
MSTLRTTRYENCPSQTQSYGCHEIRLPLPQLFDQAMRHSIARAVESMVVESGNHQAEIESLIRKCELTVLQIVTVKRLNPLLPQIMELSLKALPELVTFLEDLADENGFWRQQFQSASGVLVDRHVEKILSRIELFTNELANRFGFEAAMRGTMQFARSLELEQAPGNTGSWQTRDQQQLLDVAESLGSFANSINDRKGMLSRFRSQFSKEDREDIASRHETAVALTQKRQQQLTREVAGQVIQRILDKDVEGALPGQVMTLKRKSQTLLEIAESVRGAMDVPVDTVTVTNLVKDVQHDIDAGKTLYVAFEAAFRQGNCSVRELVHRLRTGIPVGGRLVRPDSLADLPVAAAVTALIEFAAEFFEPALPHVVSIDLTDAALQLPLANMMLTLIRKSEPYLVFNRFDGAVENHERYLFCDPELRPLIEDYCRGRVHFSNHGSDERFAIPSRHVVVVMGAVVGAGHARLDYLRGLYRLASMTGRGQFKSIHRQSGATARPLAIDQRPDSSEDCEKLFDLAVEIGSIVSHDLEGQTVYICYPLDDTIRPRFSQTCFRPSMISSGCLRGLIQKEWFVDYATCTIPGLKPDWNQKLAQGIDSLTEKQISDALVALGVLQATGSGFQFGRRHESTMPRQEFLFEEHRDKPVGLPRETFLEAMYLHDDLYTRVLVDVVLAEAAGQISTSRLPEFAGQLARKLRD